MGPTENTEKKIYVHRSTMTLGTGSTSRNAASENFYEADELPDGRVKLVLLDMNDQRTGIIEIVEAEALAVEYELVADYAKKQPQRTEDRLIEKKMAEGRAHLQRQEFNSAEYEFDQVIRIDDRQLEAHLGKGEARIGQGDMEGAQEVFARVSDMEELYQAENKHTLNNFGITLRQHKFFDQAIETYEKALKLDPDDENLFYNMARACVEKGDHAWGKVYLEKALGLKPDHAQAQKLMAWLLKKLAS